MAAAWLVAAFGCGGVASGQTCGPATHDQSGVCVPDRCGEDSLLDSGVCEAVHETAPCNPGGVFDGGRCGPIDSSLPAPADAGSEGSRDRYEIRASVLKIPADGYSSIPIVAFGTNADGSPSNKAVVIALSRPDAGSVSPASVTLGPIGASSYFTPCSAAKTPTCLGKFQFTLALATEPIKPVAKSEVIELVAPDGIGSDAPCLVGGNVISFSGDSGDYIHPGAATIKLGKWSATAAKDDVRISVDPSDSKAGLWWDLEFSSREIPALLAVQSYEKAERAPFASPGHPGIDIGGDGRGCNTISGRFQITNLTWADSMLKSFTATFEQHCEGGASALHGCVHFEQ
ncbi:MAG: hypothetical protein NVS3B20_01510 [Polyangiales bacterium]